MIVIKRIDVFLLLAWISIVNAKSWHDFRSSRLSQSRNAVPLSFSPSAWYSDECKLVLNRFTNTGEFFSCSGQYRKAQKTARMKRLFSTSQLALLPEPETLHRRFAVSRSPFRYVTFHSKSQLPIIYRWRDMKKFTYTGQAKNHTNKLNLCEWIGDERSEKIVR
jgi:hypothetical protein